MRTGIFLTAGLLFLVALFLNPAFARDKKGEDEPLSDPELIGEEVTEQSEIEKLLFTEYRKRRTKHFFLETSYDTDQCKEYMAFCETSYREFLKWANKPADFELWNTRAHVAILANKAEWECLMKARNKGRPAWELERLKNIGGQWDGHRLQTLNYSREGSTPEQDKLHLFHTLNHLFLVGLQKSGGAGRVWWLYEGHSMLREIQVFGTRGTGCISFETQAKTEDDRAWNDLDDWHSLLKRDVRQKQDEDFVLFWHKDLTAIQNKTYVKGWSIIRWMCRDDKNREKFIQFLEMLKTSNDQRRALETAFGMDPEAIDKAWRKWIMRQPTRWKKSRRRKK
jgi:hypothetical protein